MTSSWLVTVLQGILAAAAIVMVAACSPDGAPRRGPVASPNPVKPTEALRAPARKRISVDGTIQRVEAEGGVYVIRTEDGRQYKLVELPAEFREEGLGVRLEGLLHDDVLTGDMAGQAVDIIEIRRSDQL